MHLQKPLFEWQRVTAWLGMFWVFAVFLTELAHADVTVTQMANEGVILSDGESRVMIDGTMITTSLVSPADSCRPARGSGRLPRHMASQWSWLMKT